MSTHPIPLGELLDYWLGDLDEARSAAIEEHVFECNACEARLEAVVQTGALLVRLMREGKIDGRGTVALVNRFSRDRLNVRQYSVRAGEVVHCTVMPGDDMLLARLVLPEPAPARVDVSMRDADGRELLRVEDASVDRRAGEVLSFLPARPRQADPSTRVEYVVLAPADGNRIIGRYTLEHTAPHEA
jgi:anti-sigma factor RsiW